MLRRGWIVWLLSGVGACRPTVVSTAPGAAVERTGAPSPQPIAVGEASPREQLGAEHSCEVEIEHSLPRPDGFVVAYRFSRVDERLGELRASGVDVDAALAKSAERCEQERSELPEEEREWLQHEGRTCEELALTELFQDEALDPECHHVGLAYFDGRGALLHHELVGEQCSNGITTFEERVVVPGSEPLLVLEWGYGHYGALTRGGWGHTSDHDVLRIMWPRVAGDDEPDSFFAPAFEADLSEEVEGGNCGRGTTRTYEITPEGDIEIESQEWDECARESCLSELTYDEDGEADGDEDIDPCERPRVRERARWNLEQQGWDDLEAVEADDD